MKKEYSVWQEGYVVTGQRSEAVYVGKGIGGIFPEACEDALKKAEWDMSYYDPERNTYWGCKMFETEAEARKSFG